MVYMQPEILKNQVYFWNIKEKLLAVMRRTRDKKSMKRKKWAVSFTTSKKEKTACGMNYFAHSK